MEIVQSSDEAMLIIKSNDEANSYMDIKYRYIKRDITAIKSNLWTTQVSEFEFIDNDWNLMSYANCTITAEYAWNTNEWIEMLIDWNTSTKYCTWHNPSLWILFDFWENWISVKTYNRYRRYTANDTYQRDPNNRTISWSNDNQNYEVISTVTWANVTNNRNSLAWTWEFTL